MLPSSSSTPEVAKVGQNVTCQCQAASRMKRNQHMQNAHHLSPQLTQPFHSKTETWFPACRLHSRMPHKASVRTVGRIQTVSAWHGQSDEWEGRGTSAPHLGSMFAIWWLWIVVWVGGGWEQCRPVLGKDAILDTHPPLGNTSDAQWSDPAAVNSILRWRRRHSGLRANHLRRATPR